MASEERQENRMETLFWQFKYVKKISTRWKNCELQLLSIEHNIKGNKSPDIRRDIIDKRSAEWPGPSYVDNVHRDVKQPNLDEPSKKVARDGHKEII